MSRGRPPLRVGEHGEITRTQIEPGKWSARCWFRDESGELIRPSRQTPRGVFDRHGTAAESALLEHLSTLTSKSHTEITGRTLLSVLLEKHLDNLEKAKRAPRTLYTYKLRIGDWNQVGSGLRVQDCTTGRLLHTLEKVELLHGATTAKQLRTLLTAALDLAVIDGVLAANPMRAAKPLPKAKKESTGGAAPIDTDAIPEVVKVLLESEACRKKDLTDPVLTQLGSGLRISEVLGLKWSDFDPDARTVEVKGRVVWIKDHGTIWTPIGTSTKKTANIIHLPSFVVAALLSRSKETRLWGDDLIFPSSVGTIRDTTNFQSQWRSVRDDLGEHLVDTTGHSFRKTLATLAMDKSTDPRLIANALGHSDVATTFRHYIGKGKSDGRIAKLLDEVFSEGEGDGSAAEDESEGSTEGN